MVLIYSSFILALPSVSASWVSSPFAFRSSPNSLTFCLYFFSIFF